MNFDKLLENMKASINYEELDLRQLLNEIETQLLVKGLVDNIGHNHSLVRENILGLLYYRLIAENFLSHEECISVLDTCLSDSHLFKGIGSKGDDSVFFRSFSSLVIAGILETDEERSILSQDQYMLALDKAIEYMRQEVDRRGFVVGKGWAHAAAHGADMLCALVHHPRFDMKFAGDVLECVKCHIASRDGFVDLDEKRLAKVIPILMSKGLSELDVKNWICSLLPSLASVIHTDEYYQDVRILMNIEYFLMALYFIAGEDPAYEGLGRYILEFVPTMRKRSFIEAS